MILEELAARGHSTRSCAFYAARMAAAGAQLLLCPYTYLLDPLVREAVGVSVESSVVIIDEAQYVKRW